MAKKLRWGSNFSIDDLVVNKDDDIYLEFPFLELEELEMCKKKEFRCGDNTVRGVKGTDNQKIVGLSGSIVYGWDRTSYPIPYLPVDGWKEAFDRRHTLQVCRSISAIDEVPSARYKRVFPSNGGLYNSFLDHSILTMAAMWGNVYGPIAEDTRDHMFQTACENILDRERDRNVFEDVDLLTREFVRDILRNMGCYDRYNNNKSVVERIVTKVLDTLGDPEQDAGKECINHNQSEYDDYIASPDNTWKPHNIEDDEYFYFHIPIKDHGGFCYTYADRLLRVVCERENSFTNKEKTPLEEVISEEQPKLKKVKVMLYNDTNSNNAKKIVKSRKLFKDNLNNSWQTRRENILYPLDANNGGPLSKTFLTSKKLSDLNMEIWYMNQIEGEEEPLEMAFDTEETII